MNIILPDEETAGARDEELLEVTSANDLLWKELREEHTASNRKRTFASLLKKTLASCILLALCSFCLTFVLPEETRGAGNRVFRTIITGLKGNRQDIPETMVADGMVAEKLAEALDRAPFTLRFPTYLPYKSELLDVDYLEGDYFVVFLFFNSSKGAFTISQRNTVEANITLDLSYPLILINEVETSELKGLVSPNGESCNMLSIVHQERIHFLIFGDIEESELTKIAYSF